MTNGIEPWRGSASAMTGCRIAGFAIGAIFVGLVLASLPDIIRYIRISNM